MGLRKKRKKRGKAAKVKAPNTEPPSGKLAGSKVMVRRASAIAAASYFPEFLRIHLRYMRHNFRIWAALFVAPFLAIKLALIAIFNRIATSDSGTWKFDLMAIFIVALCFFLAERNREFRRIYVYAAPAIMGIGLLYWAFNTTRGSTAGFLVLAALIFLFTRRVGLFTIRRGFEQLAEGGDKDYVKGLTFFENQDFEQALPLLEKSAKHDHFKSLYLIGEAYSQGHHYEADMAKAAAYFFKAGRKGHTNGYARYEALMPELSEAQKSKIERGWF